MVEFTHSVGPRILEDGTNLDADILAGHPVIYNRQITDPVTDDSLGPSAYAKGQKNRDGSDL
jgi:hypothetical protein